MKALRVTIVSAGVFSLALAGLYSQIGETGKDSPQTEVVVGPSSRFLEPALPEKERAGSTRSATKLSPPVRDPASSNISSSSGSTRTAEANQELVVPGVEEALTAARQEMEPQRRVEALRFLGEHALQKHLNALQQIQIQDPAPEVRRAAEDAIHALMARFICQPWPGVPRQEDPFGYMRTDPSPGVH